MSDEPQPSEHARRLEARTRVDLTSWPDPPGHSWQKEERLSETWERLRGELEAERYGELRQIAEDLKNECRSIEEVMGARAEHQMNLRRAIGEIQAIAEEKGPEERVTYKMDPGPEVTGSAQGVINILEGWLATWEKHGSDLVDKLLPVRFELDMTLRVLALYKRGVRDLPDWRALREGSQEEDQGFSLTEDTIRLVPTEEERDVCALFLVTRDREGKGGGATELFNEAAEMLVRLGLRRREGDAMRKDTGDWLKKKHSIARNWNALLLKECVEKECAAILEKMEKNIQKRQK